MMKASNLINNAKNVGSAVCAGVVAWYCDQKRSRQADLGKVRLCENRRAADVPLSDGNTNNAEYILEKSVKE